jgi:hypothetical protein
MKPKQQKMCRIKRAVVTTLSKRYPAIEFWGFSWSPELHLIVSWLFGPSENDVSEAVCPIIDDVQLTLRRGVACATCGGGLSLCGGCCPIIDFWWFGRAIPVASAPRTPRPVFEARIIPFQRPRAENDHGHSGEAGN